MLRWRWCSLLLLLSRRRRSSLTLHGPTREFAACLLVGFKRLGLEGIAVMFLELFMKPSLK